MSPILFIVYIIKLQSLNSFLREIINRIIIQYFFVLEDLDFLDIKDIQIMLISIIERTLFRYVTINIYTMIELVVMLMIFFIPSILSIF